MMAEEGQPLDTVRVQYQLADICNIHFVVVSYHKHYLEYHLIYLLFMYKLRPCGILYRVYMYCYLYNYASFH